jgi:hypothetical protein
MRECVAPALDHAQCSSQEGRFSDGSGRRQPSSYSGEASSSRTLLIDE